MDEGGRTKAGRRGTDKLVLCHSRRRLAGIQRRGRAKDFGFPLKTAGMTGGRGQRDGPRRVSGGRRRVGGRAKAGPWVDEGGWAKAGPAGNGRIGLLSFPPAVSGNPSQREGERFWIPAKNCENDRRAGPAGRTKAGQWWTKAGRRAGKGGSVGGQRRFGGWTKAGPAGRTVRSPRSPMSSPPSQAFPGLPCVLRHLMLSLLF